MVTKEVVREVVIVFIWNHLSLVVRSRMVARCVCSKVPPKNIKKFMFENFATSISNFVFFWILTLKIFWT